MEAPKPKDEFELFELVSNCDVEIMLSEELEDGRSHLMICDHRRTYEEGEVYEIIL